MHDHDPPFSELGDFKQWGRFEIEVPKQGELEAFKAAASLVRQYIPLRIGGFYIIANEDKILLSGSHEANLQKHLIHLLQQLHNGNIEEPELAKETVWTIHYFTTP